MLRSLQIKNLALVNQVELDFSTGLNIISGETGAGKSILINALSLVLGGRFSKNLQGKFANQTLISAIFFLDSKHHLISQLQNLGYIDLDSDNHTDGSKEIHIRRVIDQNGLSNLYLNGQKISTKEMTEIAKELIDIHSQHSQQGLMDNHLQRSLLDQYGQIDCSKIEFITEQIKSIDRQLKDLDDKQINRERKELIGFYLQELGVANLEISELESIESDYRQASQIENLKLNLSRAESIINESESGINQQLSALAQSIDEIVKNNPEFKENQAVMNEISIAIDTIEENLSDYFQKIESAKSLEQLEPRLNQLDQLARKHQCKIKDLIEVQEKLEAELNGFESNQSKLDDLEEQKNQLIEQYFLEAKKISQKRKSKGIELAKKIESRLSNLAMKQGQLMIEVNSSEQKISPYGIDQVEFKVSLNKINPEKSDYLPLKKVASGGELSRISLAIETELAMLVDLNCLVFDEVDSGIGGDVANQVGQNLNQLARNHQVICITHLAQIAAFADQHLVVLKQLTKGEKSQQNTITIQALNQKDQRTLEIARMISGDLHAQTSLIHAQKMIELAQGEKNKTKNVDSL